jgi:hypothetical protein
MGMFLSVERHARAGGRLRQNPAPASPTLPARRIGDGHPNLILASQPFVGQRPPGNHGGTQAYEAHVAACATLGKGPLCRPCSR